MMYVRVNLLVHIIIAIIIILLIIDMILIDHGPSCKKLFY